MPAPMKTVSFKIPRRLDEKLTRLARRRRSTRSAVVREALESFTKAKRPPVGQSFAEQAGDLIGSFEGPPDLSTNPKYMDGFGR